MCIDSLLGALTIMLTKYIANLTQYHAAGQVLFIIIVYHYGLSTTNIEYSYLSVCLCWCACVCLCVCVHNHFKNNFLITLRLEHIEAWSDQGQGHGATLNFFTIYHNTNFKSCISDLAKGRWS